MISIKPLINILLIFSIFAFLHSFTVTNIFKQWMIKRLGEPFIKGTYRFIFTLFSTIITIAAFGLIYQEPYIGQPIILPLFIKIPCFFFQAVGLILLILPFKYINLLEFTGITQFYSYIRGIKVDGDIEGLNINGLITNGIYGIIRHPLYLGGIIIFTFNPYPALNTLTLSIAADIYFVIGGIIEEQRLVKIFGEQYIEYKKTVPAFIPSIRRIKQ